MRMSAAGIAMFCCLAVSSLAVPADWPQLQGNGLRSGTAPGFVLPENPGLAHAIAGSDGFYAAPVIADGTVYAIDGSGQVLAADLQTGEIRWRFQTAGGPGNCNNVAAPAVIGDRLHIGTTGGLYYVLDRGTGAVIRQLDLREPVFSAPAVGQDRVYVATLGARVLALTADGEQIWDWDFVRSVVGFEGNRWSGEDWLKVRGDRVTWKDHFVCSRHLPRGTHGGDSGRGPNSVPRRSRG